MLSKRGAVMSKAGNPPIRIVSYRGKPEADLPLVSGDAGDEIGMDDRPSAGATLPSEITEDGVALVFERRHAGALLFDHDLGAWFVWQGQCWRKETTQLAFEWARQAARDVSCGGKDGKRTAAAKSGFAGGVERFSRSSRSFATVASEWDRDPMLLGTAGGTVDLRTGLLRPADPEDRITKLASVEPALYATCPRWDRFLHEATRGDLTVVRFLKQICGYFLTANTQEHALFFIHGDGGNGKSVFINTVTKILGDYTVTAAMDTFTAGLGNKHPTELARLRGARLVTASETEQGKGWNEQRIKELTGGDTISARFMRQDFFEFTPVLKLCIIGNHRPTLANVDAALKRRLNFIPFINQPAAKDPTLEATLRAEWPAILRWMIEGCLDWQTNGLIRPEAVVKETDEYFRSQDLLGQWIEDRCEVDKSNPKCWDVKSKLYASWKTYCERAGEKPTAVKVWKDAMENRHFYEKRKTCGVVMEGLQVRGGQDAGDGE